MIAKARPTVVTVALDEAVFRALLEAVGELALDTMGRVAVERLCGYAERAEHSAGLVRQVAALARCLVDQADRQREDDGVTG